MRDLHRPALRACPVPVVRGEARHGVCVPEQPIQHAHGIEQQARIGRRMDGHRHDRRIHAHRADRLHATRGGTRHEVIIQCGERARRDAAEGRGEGRLRGRRHERAHATERAIGHGVRERKRQLSVRPPRHLPHEEEAQRLLAREPRTPRAGVRGTARLEVLLSPRAQRRLLVKQGAHHCQLGGMGVGNPRRGE